MRCIVVIVLILGGVGLSQADLTGATVQLLEPTDPLGPDSVYTFVFEVSRDMSSTEAVTNVLVGLSYGSEFTIISETMGYDEIVLGRPEFELIDGDWGAHWHEVHDGGGIHQGESTHVWFDLLTPEDPLPGASVCLDWILLGSQGGYNAGSIYAITPVESRTWGSIKALYAAR